MRRALVLVAAMGLAGCEDSEARTAPTPAALGGGSGAGGTSQMDPAGRGDTLVPRSVRRNVTGRGPRRPGGSENRAVRPVPHARRFGSVGASSSKSSLGAGREGTGRERTGSLIPKYGSTSFWDARALLGGGVSALVGDGFEECGSLGELLDGGLGGGGLGGLDAIFGVAGDEVGKGGGFAPLVRMPPAPRDDGSSHSSCTSIPGSEGCGDRALPLLRGGSIVISSHEVRTSSPSLEGGASWELPLLAAMAPM